MPAKARPMNFPGEARASAFRGSLGASHFEVENRRESSGGMEWLGVWNCIFSGSEISNFGA